jgi:hypothetical protein
MVAFIFHDEIQAETGVSLTPVHLTRAIDLDMLGLPHSQDNVS